MGIPPSPLKGYLLSEQLPRIARPAICDARGVIGRVTRYTLDDDAHSVKHGTRLVRRERRAGPQLVGAIVHDDELAPATLDEHAVFERSVHQSCIRLSVHFGSLKGRPLNVSKSSS
jgi:hypothetical protein